MNTFNKYKYFSPREIVVGMFESNNINSGFITCKFMDKGWLKTSTFKRLTDGYLPSQMKDTEAQLKKTIYNKFGRKIYEKNRYDNKIKSVTI